MIPGNIPLVLAGGGSYQIKNSLRFRSGNSGFLSRTASATPTNDKIFTWSAWVKLGRAVEATTDYGELINGYTASTDAGFGEFFFYNGSLRFSGATTTWRVSTAVFRDPSAWYHIVLSVDTTQATAANRIKIYVNGTEITSFTTSNNPTQNTTLGINNASTALRVGRDNAVSSSRNMDGYMANVYFIDGQALTPSSFGQTNGATGIWTPKSYGGSYGTNGFFLNFSDATSTTTIGYDYSGNANHLTSSGISVTSGITFDQMTDTPTNNYCTLNPLDKSSAVTFSSSTLSITGGSQGGGDTFSQTGTTFGVPTSGKWYFEFKRDTAGTDSNRFGVNITKSNRGGAGWPATRGYSGYPGYYSNEWGFSINHDSATNNIEWINNNTTLATNTSSSTATTAVYGFAIDCSSSGIISAYLYENGVLKTNSNGLSFTHPSTDPIPGTDTIFAIFKSDHIISVNFGQRPFAYTPPTDYKALSVSNLSAPLIKKPNQYFDITLRSGTSANANVTSLAFQPDFLWIKARDKAYSHNLFDSSRGGSKGLYSDQTATEYTDGNTLISFTSSGYFLGDDKNIKGTNVTGYSYVDWAWKKGATPGFDVVTFNGTGSAQTLSHSLGVGPSMMIVKNRTGLARQWSVYHSSISNSATGGIYLNLTNAWNADSTLFNNTAPTSTQFTVGTYYSTLGESLIAYLWSEVSSFSKFGRYTGNASTEGPFVWCGFRPKFIIIKGNSIATDWMIFDPGLSSSNEAILRLIPNSTIVETSNTYGLDYLSNGFKIRAPTGYSINNSAETYIYAAFAENPFKYAIAR